MTPRPVSQDPTIPSIPSPWDSRDLGFIGVWHITDDGDVPPRLTLRGAGTRLSQPAALALNPGHRELYVTDSPTNSVYTFLVPEIFALAPKAPDPSR
jgi:sugar lactone lactonase YvrE